MSICFVDSRLSEEELKELTKYGMNLFLCEPCDSLYEAISCHPDIQIHILDKNNILVHKDFQVDLIKKLESLKIEVHISENHLQKNYPFDIGLNAVNLKDYFIHKLDSTDKNLLKLVSNKTFINVNQGYTKCSTVIVNDNSLITSDPSIQRSLKDTDIDVLFIPPGDIELPGLNYGFIGGTCGLIDVNTLAFFGDLHHYRYGKEVLDFLKKHGVKPVFLRKGPLIDRGSILTIL